MNRFIFSFFLAVFFFMSCGNEMANPRELIIEDLPFHKVENAKEYADLILKALRTDRERPILQEFLLSEISIEEQDLNEMVGMYSSGIGGRDDWKFYDIHQLSPEDQEASGFDYAWLDPTGRLGIQVFVGVQEREGQFLLETIEMRSRLDVMQSRAFPGGDISSYKKIDYEWSE